MTKEVKTKVCSKCGTEKEFSGFHKQAKGLFGLDQKCKVCDKIRTHNYYTKNRNICLEKRKEYKKANKEKLLLSRRKHRKENSEIINKKNREYLRSKPGQGAEYVRQYRERNRETFLPLQAAVSAKRRSIKKSATPSWANLEVIKQIYIDCKLISEMTGVPHQVDHIIPLKGKTVTGLHVETNLRIIPTSENLSKNNKFMEELL